MSLSVVSVAFPISIPGIYDYRIPLHLQGMVSPGTPVLVPLRSRQLWGMVVALKSSSSFENLKEIAAVNQQLQLNSFASLIKLYQWISAYYHCDLGTVFKPFVRRKLMETPVKQIICFTPIENTTAMLTAAQRAALSKLSGQARPIPRTELMELFGISAHMIGALCKAGVLQRSEQVVLREAPELGPALSNGPIVLSEEQQQAVRRIQEAMRNQEYDIPFLVHGITGSGKTHVYIELVKEARARGEGAIILVPEISLTPQTIQRFRQVLGDEIAIIHSHMSDGERRDNLEELMGGRKRVVIGVRSAILAPVERVGLIIVDEEHDGSYKQSDPEPRYHARDVAIMRGHFQHAVVVLGSATPSLESYHNAQRGKFHLLTLSQRFGTAVLPRVQIVDMNKEHAEKNNWTFLSLELKGRIEQMVEQKRQVILLLNRRGFSTFLLCKDCGHIHSCPYCSVHLTYHRVETVLKCHQCGHQVGAPDTCPACGGGQLQYKGTGIQKAEEVLRETIPHARIIRMDQDTTRRKGAHVSLLEAFGSGQADILLGTQMVAKGLDFPRVGLVGVLQADTGLHVPDFRASERTFQLLTQVAGRAGRADAHGEVVIQTYLPDDPAIRASQMHDYQQFIAQELEFRKALSYPPFCRLARVIVTSESESAALHAIEALAELVEPDNRSIKRLGPAAAAVARIKSFYRFSMVLKSPSARTLQQTLQQMRTQARSFPRTIKCIIDVDPGHML